MKYNAYVMPVLVGMALLGFWSCGGSSGLGASNDFEGEYDTTGTWNLSGPFVDGRTLGDHITDVVLQKAVESSGIPSALHEEAFSALTGMVHDTASDFVDGQLPENVGPNSRFMEELSSVLTTVRVNSTLTFHSDGRATEQLTSFYVTDENGEVEVPLQVLSSDGTETVMLISNMDIVPDGDIMELEAHTFELRFGQLVEWAVKDVLAIDTAPVETAIDTALDCTTLVSRLTGTTGALMLEVGGQTFELESGLNQGCEAARGELVSKALGVFSKDSGAEVGGVVKMVDSNFDGVVDQLVSEAGYGGTLTSAPGPFEPVIDVSFTATRRATMAQAGEIGE